MSSPINDAVEKLDPTPWVVSLTEKDLIVYSAMVQEESKYLTALQDLGCQIIRPSKIDPDTGEQIPVRRALVVVPEGIDLPAPDELIAGVSAWRNTVESAAQQQDKRDTVGKRGATLPVWLGESDDTPFTDPQPGYIAAKVTHHQQAAYRGAALTAEDAKALLSKRLDGQHAAVAHSRAKGKRSRIAAQKRRIGELADAITRLSAYESQDCEMSVRLHSGHAWRIAIRTVDKRSFSSSVATIALVSGTTSTEVKAAASRKQTLDPSIEIVQLIGGMELRIKRR